MTYKKRSKEEEKAVFGFAKCRASGVTTDRHFNRMSRSIALLEALSIHVNRDLCGNNALPARFTKKSYPKRVISGAPGAPHAASPQ